MKKFWQKIKPKKQSEEEERKKKEKEKKKREKELEDYYKKQKKEEEDKKKREDEIQKKEKKKKEQEKIREKEKEIQEDDLLQKEKKILEKDEPSEEDFKILQPRMTYLLSELKKKQEEINRVFGDIQVDEETGLEFEEDIFKEIEEDKDLDEEQKKLRKIEEEFKLRKGMVSDQDMQKRMKKIMQKEKDLKEGFEFIDYKDKKYKDKQSNKELQDILREGRKEDDPSWNVMDYNNYIFESSKEIFKNIETIFLFQDIKFLQNAVQLATSDNLLKILDLLFKIKHDLLKVVLKEYAKENRLSFITELEVRYFFVKENNENFIKEINEVKTDFPISNFEYLKKDRKTLDFVLLNEEEKTLTIFELTSSSFEDIIKEKKSKYLYLQKFLSLLTDYRDFKIQVLVRNYSDLEYLENVKDVNPLFKDVLDYILVKLDSCKTNKLYHHCLNILFGKTNFQNKYYSVGTDDFNPKLNELENKNSRLFFRTQEDLKDFIEGNWDFPKLDDERSKEFLERYSDGIIKMAKEDKKFEDHLVKSKTYKKNLEESVKKLTKRLEKESNNFDKRYKGFLPFNLVLSKENKINLWDEIRNMKDNILDRYLEESFKIKREEEDDSKISSLERSQNFIFFKKLSFFYLKKLIDKNEKEKENWNWDKLILKFEKILIENSLSEETEVVFKSEKKEIKEYKKKIYILDEKKASIFYDSFLSIFNKVTPLREFFVYGLSSLRRLTNSIINDLILGYVKNKEFLKFDLNKYYKIMEKNTKEFSRELVSYENSGSVYNDFIWIMNKNRIRLKNDFMEQYSYKFVLREQEDLRYSLDRDVSKIDKIEKKLSDNKSKKELEISETYDLDIDMHLDNHYQSNYERSQMKFAANESNLILRLFNKKSISSYLYKFSSIYSDLNMMCCFRKHEKRGEYIITNCGFEDTFLVLFPGVSFAYGTANRTYYLITKQNEELCLDEGKKRRYVDDNKEKYILNGPLSISKTTALHYELALESNRDYICSSLLNGRFTKEKDDEIFHFGTRTLVYLSNDKPLSDFLSLERYISTGLTSKRSEVYLLIGKIDLVLRKEISVFFMKRFVQNIFILYSDFKHSIPEVFVNVHNQVSFRTDEFRFNFKRLFADGFYTNPTEMIEGMYLAYAVSKETDNHYHHIIKALEKMIETLSEWDKLNLNHEFTDLLPGYVNRNFDPKDEAELALKINKYFKDTGFLGSKWLIYLSGCIMLNTCKIDDLKLNDMNFDEYFEPPFSLATNKSSLLEKSSQIQPEFLQELIDMMKDKPNKKRIYKRKGDVLRMFDVFRGNVYEKIISEEKEKEIKDKMEGKNNVENPKLKKKKQTLFTEKDLIKSIYSKKSKTTLTMMKIFEEKLPNDIKEKDNFTLFKIVKFYLQELDFELLIDFFDKEQYVGDREISILDKITRDCLRFVEIFMEQISKSIPIEMISNKDKFLYQADCYKESLREALLGGGSVEYWSLDKSRWGPKLMPHFFATIMYSFKSIIVKLLGNDFFKMFLTIYMKFHSKKGIIPSQILRSWMKSKNMFKLSKIDKWNQLKERFYTMGETIFEIIAGMQQGLLQQTSTVLGSAKCYLTDYIINKYCRENNLEVKLKNGVTSDDSFKIVNLSAPLYVEELKKENLKKEVIRKRCIQHLEYPHYVLAKIDDLTSNSFSMINNYKKSYYHYFILEINQNWIVYDYESGNVFKMTSLVKKHLPSFSWVENVGYGFSNLINQLRLGANFPSVYFQMKTFKHYLLKKYSYPINFLEENEVNIADLPVELGGFPEILLTDLLIFGLKVNNYRLFTRNDFSRKCIDFALNFKGNKYYALSNEKKISNLFEMTPIKFTHRKLNYSKRVRLELAAKYGLNFAKYMERKEKDPLSLLLKSRDYEDFKFRVCEKYFSPNASEMFMNKNDFLVNLQLASMKNTNNCYFREFQFVDEEEYIKRSSTKVERLKQDYERAYQWAKKYTQKQDDIDDLDLDPNSIEIKNIDEADEELETVDTLFKPVLKPFRVVIKEIVEKILVWQDRNFSKNPLTIQEQEIIDTNNLAYKRTELFYTSVFSLQESRNKYPFEKNTLISRNIIYRKERIKNKFFDTILYKWFIKDLRLNKYIVNFKDPDSLEHDFQVYKYRYSFLKDTFEETIKQLGVDEKNKMLKYEFLKILNSGLGSKTSETLRFYSFATVSTFEDLLTNLAETRVSSFHILSLTRLKNALDFEKKVKELNVKEANIIKLKEIVQLLVVIYESLSYENRDKEFFDICNYNVPDEKDKKGNPVSFKEYIKNIIMREEVIELLDKFDKNRLTCLYCKLTNDFEFIEQIIEDQRNEIIPFIKPQNKLGGAYDQNSDFVLCYVEKQNCAIFYRNFSSLNYIETNSHDKNFLTNFVNKIIREFNVKYDKKEGLYKRKPILGDVKLSEFKFYNQKKYESYDYLELLNKSYVDFYLVYKENHKYLQLRNNIKEIENYIPCFVKDTNSILIKNHNSNYFQEENFLTIHMKLEVMREAQLKILDKIVINCSSLGLPITNILDHLPEINTKYGADLKDLIKCVRENTLDYLNFSSFDKSVVSFLDLDHMEKLLSNRIQEMKSKMKNILSSKKYTEKEKKELRVEEIIKLSDSSYSFLKALNINKTQKSYELYKEIRESGILEDPVKYYKDPITGRKIKKEEELLDYTLQSEEFLEDYTLIEEGNAEYRENLEKMYKDRHEILEKERKKYKKKLIKDDDEKLEDIEEEDEDLYEKEEEIKQESTILTEEEKRDLFIKNTKELAKTFMETTDMDEESAIDRASFYISSLSTSQEDFLLSQVSELDIDSEGFINMDKDIKKKLNIVRKGGSSFLIGNFLAKKLLMLINRRFDHLNFNEYIYLLGTLSNNNDFFREYWEKRGYVKLSYFNMKFFELKLREDRHKDYAVYMDMLWRFVIQASLVTNLNVKGDGPIRQELLEIVTKSEPLRFSDYFNKEQRKNLKDEEF